MKFRFFNTFEPVVPLFRELCPELLELGHSAEVVVATQTYRSGERRDGTNGYQVRELPTISVPFLPLRWRKASIHASYASAASMYSISSQTVSCNVFMTQPPLFFSWGRMLNKVRKQPYVCITMDMYPWLAGTAGVLSTDTALFRVLEKTAVSGLKGASAVVAIGRCMKERMISLGVAEESIHVVSNWANTEVVKPIPINKNKLRKKYELADKFVVMYSGNIGVSHYFDDLIEAAEILSEKKEIVFLFVGNGVRFEEVKTDVTKRRLKNFLFLDYQNYDDLAFSLSMGDVHFVSLREGFEGLVVPSKTYGILAAGRPVIYQGRKNGEIARLIEEQRVGTVVAQKNTARLVEAIEHAFVDEQWRKETGDRARAVAVEKYSSEQMIENYCNVLLR